LNLLELQQNLGPDNLLLEYALGDERSYAWVVSQDSIKGVELGTRNEIELTARQMTTALTARNRKGINESFPQRV
jgi:hypothetical protein